MEVYGAMLEHVFRHQKGIPYTSSKATRGSVACVADNRYTLQTSNTALDTKRTVNSAALPPAWPMLPTDPTRFMLLLAPAFVVVQIHAW